MQGESKACHQDSAPSTPMKQVVPSLTSPARQPSSWQMLRTPSPDAAHWNMHLKAEASASSEGISNDPEAWASAPVVVAIQSYTAEAEGYLSVTAGMQLRAQVDKPLCGDRGCSWPLYAIANDGSNMGWVPLAILWRCYADETGRTWICDEATGTSRWLDELEKGSP